MEQPVGVHPGVLCDATKNPITGYRFKKIGSNPSYDLCQAAYDQLSVVQARQYERIPPPLTPRRAVLVLGAATIGALAWNLIRGEASLSYFRDDEDVDFDFLELPPLSPAEQLVAFFFRPNVPATQREAAPTSQRRLSIPPYTELP